MQPEVDPTQIVPDAEPTLPDGTPVVPVEEEPQRGSVPSQEPTATEPEPVEPTPEEPAAPEPTPTPEPPAADPGRVTVLDREIPEADVQAMLGLYDFLVSNPQAIPQFNDIIYGRTPVTPTPPAPTPQPVAGTVPALSEEELADLPPGVRARLERIDSLEAMFTDFQTQRQNEAQARNAAAVDEAGKDFGRKYNMNEQEVEAVAGQLARAGHLLPAYVAQNQGDVRRGVMAALEATYLTSPTGQQREVARMAQLNQNDLERRRKASKLGGSSGVIPRSPEPAAANDPASRRLAIANDLLAAQRGE